MFNLGQFLLFLSFLAIGWGINFYQMKKMKKLDSSSESEAGIVASQRKPARNIGLSIGELFFYTVIFVDTIVVWFSKRPYYREEIIFMILFGIMILNLETIEFFVKSKKSFWDVLSLILAFVPLFFFLWRMTAFWPAKFLNGG